MCGREQVFKPDLKEASEEADRRSGSRERNTHRTAAEKVLDAKYEANAGFESRKADDDRYCCCHQSRRGSMLKQNYFKEFQTRATVVGQPS